MHIIEQIHQYLTETKANDCELHSGEVELLRIQSPIINSREPLSRTWAVELFWDHHDGEITLAFFEDASLEKAGARMLEWLEERDSSTVEVEL